MAASCARLVGRLTILFTFCGMALGDWRSLKPLLGVDYQPSPSDNLNTQTSAGGDARFLCVLAPSADRLLWYGQKLDRSTAPANKLLSRLAVRAEEAPVCAIKR